MASADACPESIRPLRYAVQVDQLYLPMDLEEVSQFAQEGGQ
ncbi:hypothetical protein ACFW1P_07010 [Paenibacillus sp. NPDC058910]